MPFLKSGLAMMHAERRKKAAKRAQRAGSLPSPGRALPGNEPPPQEAPSPTPKILSPTARNALAVLNERPQSPSPSKAEAVPVYDDTPVYEHRQAALNDPPLPQNGLRQYGVSSSETPFLHEGPLERDLPGPSNGSNFQFPEQNGLDESLPLANGSFLGHEGGLARHSPHDGRMSSAGPAPHLEPYGDGSEERYQDGSEERYEDATAEAHLYHTADANFQSASTSAAAPAPQLSTPLSSAHAAALKADAAEALEYSKLEQRQIDVNDADLGFHPYSHGHSEAATPADGGSETSRNGAHVGQLRQQPIYEATQSGDYHGGGPDGLANGVDRVSGDQRSGSHVRQPSREASGDADDLARYLTASSAHDAELPMPPQVTKSTMHRKFPPGPLILCPMPGQAKYESWVRTILDALIGLRHSHT